MQFVKNTFYNLETIQIETYHLLDFDNKAEINGCFSFGKFGLYSIVLVHNLFRSGRRGDSAGSKITQQQTAARVHRYRMIQRHETFPMSWLYRSLLLYMITDWYSFVGDWKIKTMHGEFAKHLLNENNGKYIRRTIKNTIRNTEC